MEVLQNLAEKSTKEQVDFINSFDVVLSDLDGVIWLNYEPIPGAAECMERLGNVGKSLKYITNNPLHVPEHICKQLRNIGIQANINDVSNPLPAVIAYLKKIKFNKVLYVLASESYKEEIRKAGFSVAPSPPQTIKESLSESIALIQDDENIGGVICEIDLNLTYIKLQKALTYLRREDCLFIVGGGDKYMTLGNVGRIIGNYHFQQLLRDISGREFLRLSKPSIHYCEYISEIFNIKNPSRVLVIGDSIAQDILFATAGGYQKLLVLTGNAKLNDVLKWHYSEEDKPQYYIESLGALNDIINKISLSK